MKIIAVVNHKGGVGKTTTTINLGSALQEQGKRVLLVDMDPQASLTASIVTPTPDLLPHTITEMIESVCNREAVSYEETITSVEGMDVIPSKIDLFGSEIALQNVISRETVLKRLLKPLRERYDYILLDCPPSLGVLTVNALTASDSVIVPVNPDYYSSKGLELLLRTIGDMQDTINPTLAIEGILITKTDRRAVFYKDVENVLSSLKSTLPVFETSIPTSVAAAEAPTVRMSVIHHQSSSAVAKAYRNLAYEVAGIARTPTSRTTEDRER